MNLTDLCLFFVLFSCMSISSQPVYGDDEHWDTGYHPFPEMSRFLNSHSRIHRPSSHASSHSLLDYLCSIVDHQEKIDEILNTFGRKSRPLIQAIIEEDCTNYHRQQKRTSIRSNRNNLPRTFLRHLNDHDR